MSGGVDSSVAAALLLRDGYDVVGVFMRLGSPGEALDELIPAGEACPASPARIGHQGCCSINDAADARLVAARLDIPFYVVNFKKEFGRVMDYFVAEYNAGRTPNPCIRCNDWLKFGRLHAYARQIDADFVASGHYARIDRGDGSAGAARLLRGADHSKDQSYVLFGVPRERLARTMLPIGGFEKPRVRDLAREFGLPVFDKPDSQEICFVPDNDYAGFVARRAPEAFRPGEIRDAAGRWLGEHSGHQHFTIGQRKGLRLALARPAYVVAKHAATNTIVVGEAADVLCGGCEAGEVNWLIDAPADAEWRRCTAKVRSNAQPAPARVRRADADGIEVCFDEPHAAIAPGQAVVCYDRDVVMCGGWIARAIDSDDRAACGGGSRGQQRFRSA